MPINASCAKCGAEPYGFATEGFCSACLLERGLSPETPVLAPLSRFGDYELIEEIARGGMGVVYRARQLSLNRIVAIKMILSGQFASAAETQRFRAEARAAAALQHPGIVAIHEIGEHDGRLFFSMDYVEGPNLAQLIHDGPLPGKRAAQCVRNIAEAIHYAHEHGVLHRDLKPSNVLIDAEGKPRVTDFGLAKRLSNWEFETQNSELTLSGQVLGSPNFMSPEQAAGKLRELTPASDVYALGALLYHLLTGRPPFVAESVAATLRLVSESDPVAPRLLSPAVPRDLETICLKCLDKEPRRRYATARELAEDLERFLRDEAIHARPLGRSEKFVLWTRRHPVVAALSAVIALLLLSVAVISTTMATRLQRSNNEGREKLRESLLAQARATRWSGRQGRRFDALDAIRKAAAIRPGIDLRNDAIAALSLVDVRPEREWAVSDREMGFDSSFERYAQPDTNGDMVVRRTVDDSELMRLPGVGPRPFEFGFSPNGRLLLVHYRGEGQDFQLRVYDLKDSGKVVLDIPRRWVRGWQFSRDERLLVVVWSDWVKRPARHVVSFVDLTGGEELNSFTVTSLPYGIALSPDATRLAVSSTESSSVRIHSSSDGKVLETLRHSNSVHHLDWSADGRRFASACMDGHVYLWDLTTASPSARLLPHDTAVTVAAFTPRDDMLLSYGWNFLGKLWEVETGRELLRLSWDGFVGFSADGRKIHNRWRPRTVAISEFAGADECRSFAFPYKAAITGQICVSPDARWMISSHRDGLRLWDVASGREFHYGSIGRTGGLEFTPDGRAFVSQVGNEIVFWSVRTVTQGETTRVEVGPSSPLRREPGLASHPTNRMVKLVGGRACIFDAATRTIERFLTSTSGIRGAVISPDGRYCATWRPTTGLVDIWDAGDGRLLATPGSEDSPAARFSPDSRWLITGSTAEYVFWEAGSWVRRRSIRRGETGGAHGEIAFADGGKIMALSIGRGDVGLFDANTFELLARFEPPENNPVAGLGFSVDGSKLAVSTTANTIYVWDLPLVRRQLKELGLDWPAPPLSLAPVEGLIEITFLGPRQISSEIERPPLAFPPREPRCTTDHIDLTRFYNATLTNFWHNPKWPDNDLSRLPCGLQLLNGVWFDIRGLVQLASSDPEITFPYPVQVSGIPVGRTCEALDFLHSTGFSYASGAEIGDYIIHYKDGAVRTAPLIYGENVWSWWEPRGTSPKVKKGTTLAWRGGNAMTDRAKAELFLYHFRWENPRPDVPIESITFRSRMTRCAPFLIAITAE